jgi:hypothetical protein
MLAAACSSSSKDGAAGGSGAGGSGAGGSGGGTVPLTGACANLTCLNPLVDLLSGCPASGTCTQQTTVVGTSAAVNMCYSNGVKMSEAMDASMTSMTMTVKNGSSVCYTMAISNMTSTTAMTIAVKNPSGTTVATIATDSSGNDVVTCPGGTPTVIDSTCGSDASSTSSAVPGATTGACTTGTCTF